MIIAMRTTRCMNSMERIYVASVLLLNMLVDLGVIAIHTVGVMGVAVAVVVVVTAAGAAAVGISTDLPSVRNIGSLWKTCQAAAVGKTSKTSCARQERSPMLTHIRSAPTRGL